MNDNAKRNLRNVMVFALADGELNDAEKQFIESLRGRLGIDEAEFNQLCQQVRENPKQLSLPRDAAEAEEAIRLLVATAVADGQVSQAESRLLGRLARHVGLEESSVDELIASASSTHADEIQAMVEQIYASFHGWDEPTRREKVAALAGFGRESVVPLLRILESYRVPDGAADGLDLSTLVAEQLGSLGDDRAVFYLAQQINIGDMDDEITNAALRHAAAEALGRIVGEEFSADQAGVAAARGWWFAGALRRYDKLAF